METPKALSHNMFVDGALNVLLKNLTQLAFVKKIIKLLVC
jgi:hypothetical protein